MFRQRHRVRSDVASARFTGRRNCCDVRSDARCSAPHTETRDIPQPCCVDHRGLLVTRNNLVIVGGMEKGQQVTAKVQVISRK